MGSPLPIIEAKVRRPRVEGLERARLSAVVCDCTAPGLVSVTAPPGSGKTTLLALAAERTALAAWCTTGPEDRAGEGFLHHLTRSLSVAMGRDLGAHQSVATLVDVVATTLGTAGVLLVVDDVHELAGSEAEEQLTELLRWRPPRLRVALGTRRPLALNTPRLVLSGELVELDADALRFRSWEVEELFRLVYRQPLSPEAAAALTRRTGGWAAGLKLFHLATTGKSRAERERAAAELGGRSRLLRSYLTRTVLDELDSDTRRFLLLTSTLGTLTGPLCDAVTGRSGSAAILDGLATRQFFITAAEDGGSYRYHQVMQSLLEGLLVDEYGARPAAEVYAFSARALEDAGLLEDAARAYALADEPASVARLVQHSDGRLAPQLDGDEAAADDPWLLLAAARRLHRRGGIAGAVAAYRRAEALVDDPESRRRCAEERGRAALWLPDGGGGPPLNVPGGGSVASVVRRAAAGLGPTPPDGPPLGRALWLLLAGDSAEARSALATAPWHSTGDRLVGDLASVLADLAVLGRLPAHGDADHPGETFLGRLEEVVLAADVEGLPWLARLARGVQTAVLLVLGPDDWRAESCASLVDECRRDGDHWGAMLLAIALGVALTARGDENGDRWLSEASVAADHLAAPVVRAWVELLRALAAARRGAHGSSTAVAEARGAARRCGLHRAEPVLETVLALGARSLVPVTAAPAPPTPGGTRLRVRCLGRFTVERDGVPVALPEMRPLPRALLLVLALNLGREVHRETIMSWLWPDVPVEAAAHRLHAAASSVRRALFDARLVEAELRHRGGAYELHLGDPRVEVTSDVAELETALGEAARAEAGGDLQAALTCSRRALELYTDDLLPEAGPDEWVVGERERLRLAAAAAAYAVGSLCLRLASPQEALPAAHRAIRLDPLRDSAWALLAEVQTQMGDVSAAAATRRAREEVVRELVTPRRPPPPGVRRAPV